MWSGTASLVASPATTNANAPGSNLNVTLSATLISGYQVSIFDTTTSAKTRVFCSANLSKTFSLPITTANLSTRKYTAYVATTCGTATATPSPVRATSTQVTVTNQGWTGSVSLAASPATTNANAPGTNLIATATKSVVTPYYLSIFDDAGTRLGCVTGTTTLNVPFTTLNASTHTYTAFVAQNCGTTTSVPTLDVRSTSPRAVTNQGWTGSVSLAASPTTTDANQPGTMLTATATKLVVSPYYLSIFDDDGNPLTCVRDVTSRSVGVTTVNASTHAFTAYVAQDCGSSGHIPSNDVRSTSTVSVTNAGWTGAVSIAASPATTDANQPSTMLTATATKSVVSPYYLSIFDDTGKPLTCVRDVLSRSVGVTTLNASTHVYTAYVALDCGTGSTPPANPVRSGTVSVTNAGWTGTVTLAASPTQTNATNPGTNLTATLSKQVVAPYYLSIWDDAGVRQTCLTDVTTKNVPVQTEIGQTSTYSAYVALDCGTDTPPDAAAATAGVGVTNAGWTGRLSVTQSGTGPSYTVTTTLSQPLAGPYLLSVWDDAGGSHLCTPNPINTTFDVNVTPSVIGTSTYTAYIARDCGIGGPPTNDVRASQAVSFTAAVPTGAFVGGVSIGALATRLDAQGAAVCETLGLAPGSHLQGSVSDQGAAAMAACQAGTPAMVWLNYIIVGVGTAVGTEMFIAWLWSTLNPVPAPPLPPPPGPQDPPAAPSLSAGVTTGADAEYIEWLAVEYLERPGSKTMTLHEARIAARQCNQVRQYALARGVNFPSQGDPCAEMAVYLPGTEISTFETEAAAYAVSAVAYKAAAGATVHNWAALTGAPYADGTTAWKKNPDWFVLTYAPVPPVTPGWYDNVGPCVGRAPLHCDEFPMKGTGQASVLSSLRPMPYGANLSAGGFYGNFVKLCPVAPNESFFIVPMPHTGMPSTKWVCKP